MRFFYDTEFIDDGRTIELISIGIVSEGGAEYYAISSEFDPGLAGDWVRRNVLGHLPSPSSPLYKSRATIRDEVADFLDTGTQIELWAWVGAYDHVALCHLFGDMTRLPRHIPRWTHELKQRWQDLGSPRMPVIAGAAHDALDDARHNLARWRAMHPGA